MVVVPWTVIIKRDGNACIKHIGPVTKEAFEREIKRSDAPSLSPSMRSSLQDLKLNRLWVIYPGTRRYALHEKVTALPFESALVMEQREFY